MSEINKKIKYSIKIVLVLIAYGTGRIVGILTEKFKNGGLK